MNRKETTEFLSNLLISTRLTGMGKHYASEVTLDMGTRHPKRVDFMQFCPKGGTFAGDIEKGIFICYEVKSWIEDVYSGHGLNFYGEKNYLVLTMDTYKKLNEDMKPKLKGGKSKFWDWYYKNKNDDTQDNFGILVACPWGVKPEDYYENFDKYDYTEEKKWELKVIIPCRESHRHRSMVELLFCMLRAGR